MSGWPWCLEKQSIHRVVKKGHREQKYFKGSISVASGKASWFHSGSLNPSQTSKLGFEPNIMSKYVNGCTELNITDSQYNILV